MLVQVQASGTDSRAVKGSYAAFHSFTTGRTTFSSSGLLLWAHPSTASTPLPAVIAPSTLLYPFLQQGARQDPQQLTSSSLLPGTSLAILLQQPTDGRSSSSSLSSPLLEVPVRLLTSFTAPSLHAAAEQLLRRLNSGAATPQWRYSWGLAANSPGDAASPEVWSTWVLLLPSVPATLQQQLLASAGSLTLPHTSSLPSLATKEANGDQQQLLQPSQQQNAGYALRVSLQGHPAAAGSVGTPLVLHGCPFGCLAPQHFFNSTVTGRVMNGVQAPAAQQQQQQQEKEEAAWPAPGNRLTSSKCRDPQISASGASMTGGVQGTCPACSSSSSSSGGGGGGGDTGMWMLDAAVFPGMEGGPVTCGCCGGLLALLAPPLSHPSSRVEVPLAVAAAPILAAAGAALQQLAPDLDSVLHTGTSSAMPAAAAAAAAHASGLGHVGDARPVQDSSVPRGRTASSDGNSNPSQQQQQQQPQQKEAGQKVRRPLPPWLQEMLNKQSTSNTSSSCGVSAGTDCTMGHAVDNSGEATSGTTAEAAGGWQRARCAQPLRPQPAAAGAGAAALGTDVVRNSSQKGSSSCQSWGLGPGASRALAAAAAGVVIVRTADSWASGVIASPGGIIVTNAHLFDPPQQQGTSHPSATSKRRSGTSSNVSHRGQGPLQAPQSGATLAAAAAAGGRGGGGSHDEDQQQVQVWVRLSTAGIAAACRNLEDPQQGSTSHSSSSTSRAGGGVGGGSGSAALQYSLCNWLPARLLYRFRGHLDVAVLQVRLPPLPAGQPLTGQTCSPGLQVRLPAVRLAVQGLTQGADVAVVGHGLFGPRAGFEPSVTWGSCARVILQPGGQTTPLGAAQVSSQQQQQQQYQRMPSSGHQQHPALQEQQGQPSMLITTAAVHSGASGGAVVCPVTGDLLGLVTSNARHVGGSTLPRLNFSIPAAALALVWSWAQQHEHWSRQQQQQLRESWSRQQQQQQQQQQQHVSCPGHDPAGSCQHRTGQAAGGALATAPAPTAAAAAGVVQPGSLQALKALDTQDDAVAAAIWALRPFAATASAGPAESLEASPTSSTCSNSSSSSRMRNLVEQGLAVCAESAAGGGAAVHQTVSSSCSPHGFFAYKAGLARL